MNNNDGTFCKDCDYQLDTSLASDRDYKCPSCGSKNRYINESYLDGVTLYDSLKAWGVEPGFKGKRKVRWEAFAGWEESHALRRMVRKTRTIDRDRDSYQETVIDPKNGEVIHHCEEPLSEHFGHGSDKPKP